ncbi:TonB-dependent receptor [Piscinibacter sp. XHJ-5]|uniref:TonB-dependent receptor plug domain-containing protein n=1 Tax=Piscinibacter sp. XHJ-5 TaxID=3037797 RepID=UPI002452EF08|nr:TonB-dependent receptor [Piscinibacter sp. XHJ-5]
MARLRGIAIGARHRPLRTDPGTCRRALTLSAFALQGTCALAAAMQGIEVAATPAALSRLSIEELAEVEVMAVSRRSQRLADAPAAVYVITRDQIRAGGMTTLPEALRLAPNLHVARSSSHTYAISARGFNSESSNKLLVMIDGRTVYTPLHSGVFWDVQDMPLNDVERIEVISGPGGTLWGANAVNGVINVVTRSARDTAGSVVEAVGGNDDRGFSMRHGVRVGDGAARLYAKRFDHDGTQRADGSTVADAWKHTQAGFRADVGAPASAWTLQGDAYEGKAQVPGLPERRVSGANALARWSRQLGAREELHLQLYLDTYKRRQPGLFTEDLDTVDIDAQHQFTWRRAHDVVWGAGLRHQRDHTAAGPLFAFVPADSRLRLFNVFAQDTVSLAERWKLTFGLKLERNSYTGLEHQPNLRLAWKRDEQSLWWAAVSRAVRTPSRLDRAFQVFVPLPAPYGGSLAGGPNFVSESLTAFEVGHRAQPGASTSFSVNAFYNRHQRLRSIEPAGAGAFVIGNGVQGHVSGVEAWGSHQVSASWRVHAGLSLLSEDLRFAPGSADPGLPTTGGNDPRHQFQLRSSWSLPRGVLLELGLRAVGALPNPAVPAYTALDARVAWSPRPDLELSLTGFNLPDERHAEFGAPPARSELGRRILLRALWSL